MAIAQPSAGAMDGALVRWTFEGIDATGNALAIDGMDHFVVRDGTIATNFVVFDQMQFARHSGLLPADGSRGERATKRAFNTRTWLLARVRDRDRG